MYDAGNEVEMATSDNEQDPYGPPAASAGARPSMPQSVFVALFSLVVFLVAHAGGSIILAGGLHMLGPGLSPPLVLCLPIFLGTLARNRLAWRLGRVSAILVALLCTFFGVVAFAAAIIGEVTTESKGKIILK